MAAYVIVQVDVTDPDTFDTYRAQVPATLEPFGGAYIVRGGAMEVLEGDWPVPRCVVIEFPDLESAKAWQLGASQPSSASPPNPGGTREAPDGRRLIPPL